MRYLPIAAIAAMTLLATTSACTAEAEEDSEEGSGELRSDSLEPVSTTDPSVHLGAGYNALLDRTTATRCATETGPQAASVGELSGDYYLRHIATKDELAKELEVDVSVTGKAAAVEATASTKIVDSFRTSTSKVTLLLRDVRSYVVTNQTPLALSEDASRLVDRPNDFLLSCGGSYIKSIRYQAQAVAILEFEAKSVEEAREIKASLGVSAPGVPVSGSVGVRDKIAALAQSHKLTARVSSLGFDGTAKVDVDISSNPMDAFEDLRAKLDASVSTDLAQDRAGHFGSRGRNAQAVAVMQAPYAGLPGAPARAKFENVRALLEDAERFYVRQASLAGRLTRVYQDELLRFLDDSNNQFRYNLVVGPQRTASELVALARSYAQAFDPKGQETITVKMRELAEGCLRKAVNADYSACEFNAENKQWTLLADVMLNKYEHHQRIVELAAYFPLDSEGRMTTHSYRNAAPACAAAGMRLATAQETAWLAPMVNAMVSPKGEVWIAPSGNCSASYFVNTNGATGVACDTGFAEGLPFVSDRPAICVPAGGPVPVLPSP